MTLPESINLLVAGLLTLTGVIFVGLGAPMVRGKIPMNHFYGVRFSAAFASEEAWHAADSFGGRLLVAGSVPLFGLALLSLWLPLSESDITVVALLLSPAVIAVVMAAGRSVHGSGPQPSNAGQHRGRGRRHA